MVSFLQESTKNQFEMRVNIKTLPPGPKAKVIVDEDTKYLATSTKSLPVVVRRGKGVYVEDVDDNVFIDFAAGISVNNMGHIHPYITEKVQEQLWKLWHFAGTDFYYKEQVDAAKAIESVVPGKFDKKVFFTNSGAESNEAAIKVAKINKKKQGFIGFIGGFHGRTQGALSFTASKGIQKKGLFPSMPGVEHVPFPNPYRNVFGIDGYESPEELENLSIDFIEKYTLKMYAPKENMAAFIVEPIQGEGGYVVPPKNFHKRLMKLAHENDMLVIMDEVQSGFGRTGKWFASEHFGVEPDIMSLAKAIANGIPMGATVFRADLDFPEQGLHSNTYGGNILASVSCKATIDAMRNEKAVENSEKRGHHLRKRLEELKERYDVIGDVRGLGLMQAVDFVKDRRTKEPFTKFRDKLEYKAFQNGIIVLGTGESAIRLIPPIIITDEQIDEGIDAFEKGIKQSL
ncbi:MAG: acetyl ornithine aminotransferase family protein [Candidatus Thermoplasmatota archaeon]|jgi:4-aminobutyrate aminotransferase|nr:acetyl ornithine aminotransferase family protein [Candidatus Thermoplasmatota archaeon]